VVQSGTKKNRWRVDDSLHDAVWLGAVEGDELNAKS
jgi:hypothetical protein